MTPYYGIGPKPKFQLDTAPQFIFAVGRIDQNKQITPLGTAFMLDKVNLVATAAHVVGRSDEGLVIVLNETTNLHEYQPAERGGMPVLPVKIVAHDPIHDLAVLTVITDQRGQWDVVIGSADGVGVGTDVVTLGFPHLDMGRNVLTRHHATVGAKVRLPSIGGDVKSLILNSLARPGQSGSPVFRSDTGELAAVLTGAYRPSNGITVAVNGIDPAAIHQTTHAVSAEYLKGMY